MQGQARNEREWEQWPGRGSGSGRDKRGRLRGLFTPSDAADAVAELVAERGRELEERSAQIRAAVDELEHREERARELHFRVEQILRDGAAELDLRQAELSGRSAELDTRETALEQAEAKVDERRRALGAVELRAAAVERREEAARLREAELERRAGELAELARQLDELGRAAERAGMRRGARGDEHVALAASDRYRLVVRPGPAPTPGELVELEEGTHRCVRIAASPFPGDDRSCAVLEPVVLPEDE
jgi:DNA repair exonuclease SbcCD ATPase subunit